MVRTLSVPDGCFKSPRQHTTETLPVSILSGLDAVNNALGGGGVAEFYADELLGLGESRMDSVISSSGMCREEIQSHATAVMIDMAAQMALATPASHAYFGTNQPLDKWQQFTDMDGTVIFQHKDRFDLMMQITPEMFKKTASEFKQQDVTYGKDEPTRRAEYADQYERVGAGYPVRKLKGASSNPFESFFR